MKRFKSFFSASLVLLVLTSGLTWSVSKHLCMGRVVETSFFHEAEDCGMENSLVEMGFSEEDNHCCDDESFVYSLDEDWQFTDFESIDFSSFGVFAGIEQQELKVVPVAPSRFSFSEEPPPDLSIDFQALFQTYLI